MKVVVDDALRVREFGRRGGFHANELRFYYQVVGYDCQYFWSAWPRLRNLVVAAKRGDGFSY